MVKLVVWVKCVVGMKLAVGVEMGYIGKLVVETN